MDKVIRDAICSIIENNLGLIRIPIKQRAKFEGWLKFELAYSLKSRGFENVMVEASYDNGERCDISFCVNDEVYYIELKTPNTNLRQEGIENKQRPITKNIKAIIYDTKKLKGKNGIIAFILFPVPENSNSWTDYIKRISVDSGIDISPNSNCSRMEVILDDKNSSTIVICTFKSY